jgi:hypothetical protein
MREKISKNSYAHPTNLKLMLDLGIISVDANPATAELAWNHLIADSVIAAREKASPGEKEFRDVTNCGHATHWLFRVDVMHQIIAEMSEGEKADLRTRLLARRVKDFPSAPPAANQPVQI